MGAGQLLTWSAQPSDALTPLEDTDSSGTRPLLFRAPDVSSGPDSYIPLSAGSDTPGHQTNAASFGPVPTATSSTEVSWFRTSWRALISSLSAPSTPSFFASASAAVYDSGDNSLAIRAFLMPVIDFYSQDRLVFFLPAVTNAALTASKKTVVLGAVLSMVGLFVMFFPQVPVLAAVLLVGMLLVGAGMVSLLSFLLLFSAPGSVALLLLSALHLLAGGYILVYPHEGAFWLTILIAAWLIVKGLGRMRVPGPHAALSSMEEGGSGSVGTASPTVDSANWSPFLSLLVGVLVVLLASFWHHTGVWPAGATALLGFLFGCDIFLAGVLVATTGLQDLEVDSGPRGGVRTAPETDPLVQGEHAPAPCSATQV